MADEPMSDETREFYEDLFQRIAQLLGIEVD
jgi:hypothetical protein